MFLPLLLPDAQAKVVKGFFRVVVSAISAITFPQHLLISISREGAKFFIGLLDFLLPPEKEFIWQRTFLNTQTTFVSLSPFNF